jgi:apolipoprotein D and lipocalin family protein
MRLNNLLLFFLCGSFAWALDGRDPSVVTNLDITKYMGQWYEIAHNPNFFQNLCERSTAQYDLTSDGKVSVLNKCFRGEKEFTSISGTAEAKNPLVPAKLEVDFGFFRTGDYWIVDLDENYQWAVVSGPNMKSLFILARKAPMEKSTLDTILENLKSRGFKTSNLIYDKY